jgi:putative inorganic carbon (HCO3(-)) transporter
MPLRPDTTDYESLFPSRAPLAREDDVHIGSWSTPSKVKSEKVLDGKLAAFTGSSIKDQSLNDESLLTKSETWIRRRGHTLSFAGLFLFSVILYLRPYELFPALSSFKSMAFYTGLATLIIYGITQVMTEGNLTARPREVTLALLLGIAAILSIPLAIDPNEAWTTFSEHLVKAILIFIVIVNVVRTERRLKLLILLALAVSVYLSINAIQDYQAGLFQVGKVENNNLRIAGRIKGLFENSNDLAMHLVSMAPIAFVLAFAKRGVVGKIVYLTVAVLMVAAIVVTFSRGGFLGLLAISFVLVRKLGRNNRASATAGFALAVVLFLSFAPGDYAGRILTIFDTAADITGSSSQRNQVLQRSVLVALRYPLFGVGLGNFHHKSYQELGTHNAYTQVGSEMGIAAMVIYMMLLIAPLRRLRQIERESHSQPKDRRFYYLAIGLQASLIGFMVSSFFGAVAYQWYLYYLVGYAICLHRVFLTRSETASNRSEVLDLSSSLQESKVHLGNRRDPNGLNPSRQLID